MGWSESLKHNGGKIYEIGNLENGKKRKMFRSKLYWVKIE